MVIGYLETLRECPECHKYGVHMVMTKEPMKIDGKNVWPMTERCRRCGWELPEEEVIKSWREFDER